MNKYMEERMSTICAYGTYKKLHLQSYMFKVSHGSSRAQGRKEAPNVTNCYDDSSEK